MRCHKYFSLFARAAIARSTASPRCCLLSLAVSLRCCRCAYCVCCSDHSAAAALTPIHCLSRVQMQVTAGSSRAATRDGNSVVDALCTLISLDRHAHLLLCIAFPWPVACLHSPRCSSAFACSSPPAFACSIGCSCRLPPLLLPPRLPPLLSDVW